MGRPTLHDSDALLDAAVRLFARDGVRGLTVAAVAREAKAPSGSVYHRFPDRPSLLAAVWLRTVRRFHDAYVAEIGDGVTPETAVAGAAWTVAWCREHLGEALVLQAGATAFDAGAWPQTAAHRWEALQAEQAAAIGEFVRSVAAQSGTTSADVAFAMFDLPLAVVRPHLIEGAVPPADAVDAAARMASAILGCADPLP
ncbi:helix-turn-helix domain containing protein [Tsukamurella sp. 8F]|uniref:TetR/AcrR family transcriptional regulator n=1 Tax=unclassified Tsukamurella TaxID=2633480 RepID=UPI0023B9D9F6|nr:MULTISPECIES: TetR/AcrR family transcriptional regulator [unclassified Tsukamurella]MDF0532468.1 helix-turn-helix domain containing protein [Tsukamurella sp. 8J]MDF0589331.1 helix-turn-helix domain containing protein [Tsukamurella sp. 8F]